jgi:ABC-type branched-subunit amino acid transport system substrate-binding protein
MQKNRRNFIKAVGVVGACTMAGCTTESESSGGSTSEGESTSEGGTTGGTASSSGSGPTVTFGYGGSLTGKWDFLEDSMGPLLKMAIEEINDAGGPLGGTLEMSRRDTQVQVDRARQVMQQHINSDDVNFLMGYNSTVLVPLWDFIQEQERPLITPWMGSTFKDTRGGDQGTPEDLSDDEWVWRSIVSDSVSTASAAIGMRERGIENFGVLNGTSAGERAWSNAMIASTKPVDQLNMVTRIQVEEGKSSYQTELSRLFSEELDAWVLAIGLQDAQTILREWDQGGYGVPVLLENALQQEQLLEQLRSAIGTPQAELLLYSQFPDGPQKQKVRERYAAYTDQDMIPWNYAGWDGLMTAMLAIERAGSAEPDAIQRNLGPVTRPGEDKVEVTSFAEGKEELEAGNEINYQGALSAFNYTDNGNVASAGTAYDVSVEDATFTETEQISEDEINDIITDSAFAEYLESQSE